MNLISLQSLALAVSQERSSEQVLNLIVEGLADQEDIALARIWLLAQGDICDTCLMREECSRNTTCLHLVASDGRSVKNPLQRWQNLTGDFQRFPLGVRKVGVVGASGESLLLTDVSEDSEWLRETQWAEEEKIRSFAGQPLLSRGERLGVLAVFSRGLLDQEDLAILRTFADNAASAISNARAFEEIDSLRSKLEQENRYLRDEIRQVQVHEGIVGKSPALMQILEQVELVARTDANVLIQGESGTGKELIGCAIHDKSERSNHPIIKVNCASIPKDLFESEFFGHVRGAFTGALRDRIGRFKLADNSTLFLDEVGEIPLELQGKLLRVLQERTFERVGDDRTHRVNVRIIAATNKDLAQEVAAGRFRQDLFYRLNVFPITVPPLKDRVQDIPLLADHFLRLAVDRFKIQVLPLDKDTVERLKRYSWPGNVRELQNIIERAVITAQAGNVVLDLPGNRSVTPLTEHPDLNVKPLDVVMSQEEIRKLERNNVVNALKRSNGKVSGRGGAAELLGIPPSTLASKIKKLKIKKRDPENNYY